MTAEINTLTTQITNIRNINMGTFPNFTLSCSSRTETALLCASMQKALLSSTAILKSYSDTIATFSSDIQTLETTISTAVKLADLQTAITSNPASFQECVNFDNALISASQVAAAGSGKNEDQNLTVIAAKAALQAADAALVEAGLETIGSNTLLNGNPSVNVGTNNLYVNMHSVDNFLGNLNKLAAEIDAADNALTTANLANRDAFNDVVNVLVLNKAIHDFSGSENFSADPASDLLLNPTSISLPDDVSDLLTTAQLELFIASLNSGNGDTAHDNSNNMQYYKCLFNDGVDSTSTPVPASGSTVCVAGNIMRDNTACIADGQGQYKVTCTTIGETLQSNSVDCAA